MISKVPTLSNFCKPAKSISKGLFRIIMWFVTDLSGLRASIELRMSLFSIDRDERLSKLGHPESEVN